MWGCENFGIAWRYYSEKPRFVGAVGIDLEYIERGFNMGYTYTSEWVGVLTIPSFRMSILRQPLRQ